MNPKADTSSMTRSSFATPSRPRPLRFRLLSRMGVLSVCLVGAALSACGAKAADPTDTNTNWLKSCVDSDDCSSGLECLCGVCTQDCSSDNHCRGLSSDAVCKTIPGECADDQLVCTLEKGDSGSNDPDSSDGNSNAGDPPRYELTAVIDGQWCGDPARDYVTASCAGATLACMPGFEDACGCGCYHGGDGDNPVLDEAALPDGPWYLLPIAPEDELALESLVRVPDGFMALYRRSMGSGKVIDAWQSWLLHSSDGLTWKRTDVELADNAYMRALAYGNGTYVAAGAEASSGVVWTSKDAQDWTAQPTNTQGLRHVEFVAGRFYAASAGFEALMWSTDGTDWHRAPFSETAVYDLTFGTERFGPGTIVAVGSGPMVVAQYSSEFFTDSEKPWQEVELDCTQPGFCSSDPDGVAFQTPSFNVVYNPSLGLFHATYFTSADGVQWQPTEEREPHGVLGESFVHLAEPEGSSASLQLWTDGPVQQQIDLQDGAPAGKDCASNTCLIFNQRLVLLP